MDTQIRKLQEPPLLQHIGRIVGAMMLILFLAIGGWYSLRLDSPYISQVLSLRGDQTLGHAIFQTNCAGCHGLDAGGKVGPSLYKVSKRKSPSSLIEQVISGKTPPMPQFQPNPQAMADLLSYLETL